MDFKEKGTLFASHAYQGYFGVKKFLFSISNLFLSFGYYKIHREKEKCTITCD